MAAAAPSTNDQLTQPKRLIVCCDGMFHNLAITSNIVTTVNLTSRTGTWEDSTSDLIQAPTNVTRLTRALSRNAIVEENGVTTVIPQVVYYQKGVGTSFGDIILGGTINISRVECLSGCFFFLLLSCYIFPSE
jgi:uncharacterized protein (DUF2235 family)